MGSEVLPEKSKVLMVGAGGIGCELLKTLVLSGFKDIHLIDMDTIEVSNLNRQFLFRKHHVGMSKAEVARGAVLKFRPDVNIVAYHANVKDQNFNVEFYQLFNVVLNGLDNLDARRHVNRLCLAAGVPLIESGTTGYLGQVTVHVKGKTECYECHPKPAPKTYPTCTITNTPSKPVHCIVWAKELAFVKIFGDKNQAADLNIDGDSAKQDDCLLVRNGEQMSEFSRRVFDQIFGHNIDIALKNEDQWKSRKKPSALYLSAVLTESAEEYTSDKLKDPESLLSVMPLLGLKNPQEVWSLEDNTRVFLTSMRAILETRNKEVGGMSFDKDDQLALEFVSSAANIRAYSFGIPMLSIFDIKGIAGNIVHAIATTNAIISGLIVIEAVKLLRNDLKSCRTTFCLEHPSSKMLIMPVEPFETNPNCYVCSNNPLVLEVNTINTKLKEVMERIIKAKLGVSSPVIMHGNNLLYETGEDLAADETLQYDANLEKKLSELPTPVLNGDVLSVEDLQQEFKCTIHIKHRESFDEEKEADGMVLIGKVGDVSKEKSTKEKDDDDDDDDVVVMVEDSKKRKITRDDEIPAVKKQKL